MSLLLQISVCAGCGIIAFLMSDLTYYTDANKYPDTYLSSPLLPILISLLVGYTVAQCFFNVRILLRPHSNVLSCRCTMQQPLKGHFACQLTATPTLSHHEMLCAGV